MTSPAPLDVSPSPTRSRKSRRKKQTIGVIAVAVAGALIAIASFGLGARKPSAATLREFVATNLKAQNQPLTIVKFDRSYKGAGDSGQALFAGEVELTEPRYVKVDTVAYLQSEFGVTLPTLQNDLALLKSRLAGRVRELVGPPPATTSLGELVLVKQPVRIGTRLRLSGSVRAERVGSLWQFDLVSLQVTPSLPAGEKRPAGTLVYDVSDLGEQTKLRQLVNGCVDYAAKIKAARPKLEADIQRDREDRMAAFAQLMRPGALWVGTAIDGQNETHRVVLETTECSAKTGTVTALLRNDGGWTDARSFSGQWSLDDSSDHCRLNLQTRASQRIDGAGPLLEINDTWNLEGELTSAGVFEAKTSRWQFHLQRVPEAELASTRTALMAPFTQALAATARGTVYHGAAVAKNSHASEQVLLRFTEQEADGTLVTASLVSAAHESWKRTLRGTIIASRFRTGDEPIRLRSEESDRATSAGTQSVLGAGERLAIALRCDGNDLVGEDANFTYRFERADAAWLAAYNAKQAERSARFYRLIKAGAAYDGTARDERGMINRLRLRIVEVDPHENTLSAIFESRDEYGIFHRMSGSCDVAAGLLQLGTSGTGKYDAGGGLHLPLFTGNWNYRVTLQLDDDGLNGKLENQGWTLSFALNALAPALPEAQLPSSPGAYVLSDGRWQLLPRNNGRTVYAAAQVLGGVLNALHAWDSRIPAGQQEDNSAQAATLVFDGNIAAPSAPRDDVVIVYIGDLNPPPAALKQKYSELRDYPAIEMARTQQTRDAKREAPLLKIVPGFSGFGNTRIAASIDQLRANATLLRSTGPLDPGSYAVTIGSAAFEVNVR